MKRVLFGAALAAVAFTDRALAQEAGAGPAAPAAPASTPAAVTAYPPEFFADLRPANAMDMINRVPGFTFKKGEEVRGFSGAAGNVLIDGERPSSKSVALDQVLQRIPVSAVERIEVIRGGAPGIDMQGEPVVANVVRKKGALSTGALQLMFKPYQVGYLGFIPRLEGTWSSGPWSAEGAISGRKDLNTDSGEGSLVRRRAGTVLEAGRFVSEVETNNFQANLSTQWQQPADTVRVNLGVDRNETERVENADLFDRAGTPFVERTHSFTRRDKREVGGDYRHRFGEGLSGQLIALHTEQIDKLKSRGTGRAPEQASRERGELAESILRGVLTAENLWGMTVEAGAEGALNALESRSALTRGGVVVAVPSANVRVEEERAEGFASVRGKLAPRLAFDGRAAYETSTISQSGGASASKTLAFFKPSLNLAYDVAANTQVRARVERTVGQLNFKDFAATAELEAGTVNAGNPDIEPERAWEMELALEQRFWGRGAIVLTAVHAEVQQVVDLIPVGGRFDAPGNIGDGTRDELRLSFSAPLDRLGVTGGLAQLNGTWRRSEVTDPVTGQSRRISGQRPFEGSVVISKSLPALKSTVAVDTGFGYRETFYRINEIRTNREQPLVKIYWDWAPRTDLIFRFQAENITAKARKRERTLYAGSRASGVVDLSEERSARLAPFLMMRARKTF